MEERIQSADSQRRRRGLLRWATSTIAFCVCCAMSAQSAYPANVSVDMAKAENILAPRAIGIHASVYDNNLQDAAVPTLLTNDGVLTLRYPGGGYSDCYHWSTNTITPWKATSDRGWIARGADFGSFVRLIDRVGGTAVITVNYGSNAAGTGPGEPDEAAAWVAYANGKPEDPHFIGKDSTGFDWKTTGYWASLRAARPLPSDDGYNFLRIGHPQGLNIKYWEIGNELFGNGFYSKDGSGYENDLHVPYNKNPKDDANTRPNNAKLSPTTYGRGVVAYSQAMKAVDPRISIGAVLNTPPFDFSWGPTWDKEVLAASWQDIDFVVLHWYTGNFAAPDYKNLDNASLLDAPTQELPQIMAALLDLFKHEAHGKMLQLAVTELGSRPYANVTDPTVLGLFAADAYASLAEDGAVNIDWLELHKDTFLDGKDDAPHAAYFGVQMLHRMMNMRDTFVVSSSGNVKLSVHAARRADGSLGLMLVNKDPDKTANVVVKVSGGTLGLSGMRLDWGKSKPASGISVQQSNLDGLGNKFTVSVPPYTVTDVVIPVAQK
jgi:hypothetical protein